jgi:hypothetical protein
VDLASVTGAGLSLMTKAGNSGIVYATDAVAEQIEELQFSLGEGPCVDAFSTGHPVFIADLDDPSEGVAERWPGFISGAAALGVRAVFAFSLTIGAIRIGAMDLYRCDPGPLGEDELAAALLAADVAALSLLDLDSGAGGFADMPHDRSTYRLEVHQATGMVKVQVGRSMGDALLLLRARAFADGRSVASVAADVVSGRLRFPEEDQ